MLSSKWMRNALLLTSGFNYFLTPQWLPNGQIGILRTLGWDYRPVFWLNVGKWHAVCFKSCLNKDSCSCTIDHENGDTTKNFTNKGEGQEEQQMTNWKYQGGAFISSQGKGTFSVHISSFPFQYSLFSIYCLLLPISKKLFFPLKSQIIAPFYSQFYNLLIILVSFSTVLVIIKLGHACFSQWSA